MAVLVTGGAGFIGSHMVYELLGSGEQPVVLDDLSTGFRSALPVAAPLIIGDIGDRPLLERIIPEYGIDAVIHFAAKVVVPESVSDPLAYYDNNTCKSRTLIKAAVDCGIQQFIFSSTAAVYGQPRSNPVSEDTPLEPVSPYGRSKLMVEWMLADAARAHGLHYAVLRYFNVAGADPQGRTGQSTKDATHLIKVACEAALGTRPGMEVFGTDYPTPDGSCVRDYIHVSDLVRAHMDALRHLRAGGASVTCNCGYARGYSVLEVIKVVKDVSGVDFPVTISGRRPGDAASIVASNDRIKTQLGWRPQYDDLREIVRQALDWERRLAAARVSATA